MTKRTAFFVSDGTGLTAATLGQSLLTQFGGIEFNIITIPYVDSLEKLHAAIARINQVAEADQAKPLVFTTLIDAEFANILQQCNALTLNFFQTFITPLEEILQTKSSHSIGKTHGIHDSERYKTRIDAINYTLSADDGANPQNYAHADVILIGVSRCGKTPTCLYLALQFGAFAANYPFTEDDFPLKKLPEFLQKYRQKLYGLTIAPERLQKIRAERRPDSRYASLEQCKSEVAMVEELYNREKIPYLSTTTRSIEEIATTILTLQGITRPSF